MGEINVMKSMEKLEEMYNKELKLAEDHKKRALDIKNEMDMLKGKETNKKINSLKFNGIEYDKFMRLLDQDKKTVMEAVNNVLGEGK